MPTRSRVFAFIAYPESCEASRLDQLVADLHVQAAISPLHDSDYLEDGTQKKAHWHVMLIFTSQKMPKQVLTMLEPIGINHVEIVNDQRGYARYLCHMDSPEKFLYDVKDVETYCGYDYLSIVNQLTTEQKKAVRDAVLAFVRDFNITEYANLVEYCMSEGAPGWLDYVEGHTIFLNGYIRSKHCAGISE